MHTPPPSVDLVTHWPTAVQPSDTLNPHTSGEGQSESDLQPAPPSGSGGQVRICQPQVPPSFSLQTPVGPAIDPSQQRVVGISGSGPHLLAVQLEPASFGGGAPASECGGVPPSETGHPIGSQVQEPLAV